MKKIISVFVLLALIIPGLLLAGKDFKQGSPHNCQMMKGEIFHMLELTDEQKEKIHEINLEFRKKTIPLQADLKLARIDLKEAFANKDSEQKVKNVAKKVADIKKQLFMLNIDKKLEIRGILTEKQLEKLDDWKPCIERMRGEDRHKRFNKRIWKREWKPKD
ncbi:MAG: Spy/CpxP family protein refolding chaperone [Candidatus Marinimicrobia bacterium]|nr:Spy/CpxP family protein refolding chaperone [Candidatus Neomarinimicrobiota bacterium]